MRNLAHRQRARTHGCEAPVMCMATRHDAIAIRSSFPNEHEDAGQLLRSVAARARTMKRRGYAPTRLS